MLLILTFLLQIDEIGTTSTLFLKNFYENPGLNRRGRPTVLIVQNLIAEMSADSFLGMMPTKHGYLAAPV